MSGGNVQKRWRSAIVLAILATGLAALAAACGGGGSSTTAPATTAAPPTTAAPTTSAPATGPTETGAAQTGASAAQGARIQAPGQCGDPKTQGQKATGTPIKIGAIYTDVPGLVFGTISNGAKAFFDCVNDNGGIGGHPVQFIEVNDRGDANAAHADAVKLWENDKVLAFVGSSSTVECEVNHTYYEQHNINAIVAGGTPSCFSTPNIAATNQGPYYSISGATWWALNKVHANKIVCAYANVPGLNTQCQGAKVQADELGVPIEIIPVDLPITDPASLVLKMAQDAGKDGAAVPGFTEDDIIEAFKQINQQGLIDATHWYEGATGSSSNLAPEFGPEWEGKFFAQSEYNPPDAGVGPDTEKYRAVSKQYIPQDPLSNFGEFGYTAGLMATEAMLRVVQSGQELNQANVNAAIRNVINIPTDLLCKHWYFGNLKSHLPNNGSFYTTWKNGKAVLLQPNCEPQPVVNADVAQAYLDEEQLGIPQLPGTPTHAELEADLQKFSK